MTAIPVQRFLNTLTSVLSHATFLGSFKGRLTSSNCLLKLEVLYGKLARSTAELFILGTNSIQGGSIEVLLIEEIGYELLFLLSLLGVHRVGLGGRAVAAEQLMGTVLDGSCSHVTD